MYYTCIQWSAFRCCWNSKICLTFEWRVKRLGGDKTANLTRIHAKYACTNILMPVYSLVELKCRLSVAAAAAIIVALKRIHFKTLHSSFIYIRIFTTTMHSLYPLPFLPLPSFAVSDCLHVYLFVKTDWSELMNK